MEHIFSAGVFVFALIYLCRSLRQGICSESACARKCGEANCNCTDKHAPDNTACGPDSFHTLNK